MRTLSVSVGVNPPVFGLEASEGDVWATKATIHVVGKDKEYMKTQPIVIEYIKSSEYETGTWVIPTQTKDGDVIEITGLPEDPLNTNKYTLRAVSGDVKAENELEITTEVAADVDNADFEDWHYTTEQRKFLLESLIKIYLLSLFPIFKECARCMVGYKQRLFDAGEFMGSRPGYFLFICELCL